MKISKKEPAGVEQQSIRAALFIVNDIGNFVYDILTERIRAFIFMGTGAPAAFVENRHIQVLFTV